MTDPATHATSGSIRPAGAPSGHRPAGWVMLHPVAVAALLVLVVNDHVTKALAASYGQFQGVTGKLSDVAGLTFFPLLLVALTDLGLRAAGRGRSIHGCSHGHRRMVLTGSVVVSGVGFAAIQVLPAAAEAYAAGLEFIRWLPSGVAAGLTGSPAPAATGVNHVMDPTDVWCVPAVMLADRIGASRLGLAPPRSQPPSIGPSGPEGPGKGFDG